MINVRYSTLKKLPETEQEKSRKADHVKPSVRSFAVVKGMFWYRETRLRGLSKVDAQLHMLFAPANLVPAESPSVLIWYRICSWQTDEFRCPEFDLSRGILQLQRFIRCCFRFPRDCNSSKINGSFLLVYPLKYSKLWIFKVYFQNQKAN